MIPFEKQCVSLDLAKRLKELGARQESLYFWKPARGKHICHKPENAQHVETLASLTGFILPS